MVEPLVIVTRPGDAGQRLQAALRDAGWDAQWWPAFDIGPAPDEPHARHVLASLADFDLAIFVSPAAVRAAAGLRSGAWPDGTSIGAVGAATAATVREVLQPGPRVELVAPPAADDTGSEAFLGEWQRRGLDGRRVLIVRAQHGREWLAQHFAQAGSTVEVLAVYTRSERPLDPAARRKLTMAVATGAPAVTVFSSSEAIGALERSVHGEAGAAEWLRRGAAIATHPRIADRLLAAGYGRVVTSTADDEAVRAQLESL